MRSSRSLGKLVGLVAAGAIVAAGCTSSGSDGGGGGGYSIADAVDQVPPSIVDDNVFIYTGDLVTASEVAGLERPDDLEDVIDWIVPLTGVPGADLDVPVFLPLGEMSGLGLRFGGPDGLEEFENEVGFSLLDVDHFVEVSHPPRTFAVVGGDFGDDPLADLEETGDGVFTHGSGEDLHHDIENRNAVDQLGRPIRFAERDGRVAMSTVTPAVEDWLDGDDAGLDDLRAMAEVLDDAGAYGAILNSVESGYEFQGGPNISPEQYEHIVDGDWLPTEPFHAVAIGWGAEDGEAIMTLVFAHDDSDAAEANVERFEAMVTEGVSISSGLPMSGYIELIEATTDDNLVVLTVSPTEDVRLSFPFNALIQRDAPFVHE